MSYRTLLEKLYLARPKEKKSTLDRMQALCALLGSPERAFKSIHVAGTNGKGSSVTKIGAALSHCGYKVGIYTSPHIWSFCERIQIGSKMISEEEAVSHLEPIFAIAEDNGLYPTFFELTTCLAFCYFAKQKVDLAVLETGIGGRLDATNMCDSMLSVITSISLDHTELLGNTLEEIAFEKAGIIKPPNPCVIGPSVPVAIVASKETKVVVAQGPFSNYEEENQLIAKTALAELGVAKASIDYGLSVIPPCRFQTFTREWLQVRFGPVVPKLVILDVAHNPDGLKRLFERLDERVIVLCGLGRDKDVKACLEPLLEKGDELFLVQSESARAMAAKELQRVAQRGIAFENLSEGIEAAFSQAAKKGQILVVCGTFYIMSQVSRFLCCT